MKKILSLIAISVALVSPAIASAFWGGTVINVSHDDTLNVRKWPASHSQIIYQHDNHDNISLLGRCKNAQTNVSFYIDGGQSANWKYNKMKKPDIWCQTMTPNGKIGWVRGKFVWPE